MEEKIVKLLEQYEDFIMRYTLGDFKDEEGKRYTRVYKYEWEDHKQDIAYTLNKLINSKININSIGLAYIIITEWSGVMTFSDGDLDIKALEEVCKEMLVQLL